MPSNPAYDAGRGSAPRKTIHAIPEQTHDLFCELEREGLEVEDLLVDVEDAETAIRKDHDPGSLGEISTAKLTLR